MTTFSGDVHQAVKEVEKPGRRPDNHGSLHLLPSLRILSRGRRKVKQRTILGLGELLEFPTEAEKKELSDLLTSLINEGSGKKCDNPRLYDAALGFYGKWLEEKREAQERADHLAEEARRKAEETFKTLKSDLDIRPVYHKTDDASKAHLNLAVLAYWVVSTTKYMLKKKGINVRWEELLRIMSTQQRVTLVAEQDNGHILKVRRSTTP